MINLFNIRSRRAVEIHRRIKLAVAAYSYELLDKSIMPDHEYDRECRAVDLSIDTGNDKMDKWFRKNFDPSTGVWIHQHPELNKIRGIYEQHYANRP